MWRAKEPTQYEVAVQEMFAARRNRDRIMANFNYCEPAFFDIANDELTIAQMQLEVCVRKVRLLEA